MGVNNRFTQFCLSVRHALCRRNAGTPLLFDFGCMRTRSRGRASDRGLAGLHAMMTYSEHLCDQNPSVLGFLTGIGAVGVPFVFFL